MDSFEEVVVVLWENQDVRLVEECGRQASGRSTPVLIRSVKLTCDRVTCDRVTVTCDP